MHPIITDFPRGVPAFWVIIFTHRLPCWIHATQSVVHHHLGACGRQKFMSHPRPPKPRPVVSQGPHVKVWDAQLYRMWPHRSGHTWSHQEWVPKLKAGICWPASNLWGSWQELCAEHAPWWTEDSQARFFFFLRGETGIHTQALYLCYIGKDRENLMTTAQITEKGTTDIHNWGALMLPELGSGTSQRSSSPWGLQGWVQLGLLSCPSYFPAALY